jgi:hypothetical protein
VLRVSRQGESLRDALHDAVSARGPDYRGPRWRPAWADPAGGREPVKLRMVRDEYTELLLPSHKSGDAGESQRQALLGF